MKSFSIYFEQRNFREWDSLVKYFMRHGTELRSAQNKDNSNNWWRLLEQIRDDEQRAIREKNKQALVKHELEKLEHEQQPVNFKALNDV